MKASNLRPDGGVNAVALVSFPNDVNAGEGIELDQQIFTFEVDPENEIKDLDEENNTAESRMFDVELGAPGLLFEPPANETLPGQVLSGTGKPLLLTTKVTNFGNLAWDPDAAVTYYITPVAELADVDLTDAVDNGGEIDEEVELDMAKLAPGKSRDITLTRTLERNVPSGDYHTWLRVRAVGLDGELREAHHSSPEVHLHRS